STPRYARSNCRREHMTDEPSTREVARYLVELHWHAPRTWGATKLPHGGRFYAWVLVDSPRRRLWAYTEATGAIGAGGVEATELAVLASRGEASSGDLRAGDEFELSRSGVEGVGTAARGRVIRKTWPSN